MLTLTYRGTPPDYEQARKDVRNYLRAVKRMREKAGLPEMKYIYVLEEEGADGEKRRVHVHLMMSGGVSREALEEKWGRGYANCDRLQPEEGTGLLELARYFTKQGMEKHRRAWSASKNLRQPRTTVSRTHMSNAKVRRLCQEMPGSAAEIMGKLYPAVQGGRGGAVHVGLDTGGLFADTAAEAMPMSGKKQLQGGGRRLPFWRCETPLTITCEGWMAGCDVQLRFSGQGEEAGLRAQAVQAHGRVGEVSGGGGRGEEV